MVERVCNVVMRVHKAGVTGTGRSGTLREANGGVQLVLLLFFDPIEIVLLFFLPSHLCRLLHFISISFMSKTTGVLWLKDGLLFPDSD